MDNNPTPENNPTDPVGLTTSPEQNPLPAVESTPTNDPTTISDPPITNPEAPVSPKKPHKLSKKSLIIIIIAVLIVLGTAGTAAALILTRDRSDAPETSENPTTSASDLPDRLTDFDLAFLKQENATTNFLYSPLSIKYALAMLEEGAAGDSKAQIEAAVGSLTLPKYPSNNHMSFANALFINNKLPDDTIKTSYAAALRDEFGAEVLRIPFSSAVPINNWVSDKTFGLIKELVTDETLQPTGAPEQYFALINALAIDMEWINKIQPQKDDYSVSFRHINYGSYVNPFEFAGFNRLSFDGSLDVNALELAATINKYNILEDLGVDNIRQTIIDEYSKWLVDEDGGVLCAADAKEPFPAPEVYVEEYLQELGDGGYKTVKSSTDFSLYDDDDLKAFAKDLKTYDDVTLQYVGIMPKSVSLQSYVKNLTTDQLNTVIDNLKTISYDNFKDGVITDIHANIPVFKFQGGIENLPNSLESIGITDIFSETKANLSGITDDYSGLYIGDAVHKATIDFSNDGIKASAATALVGGKGAGGCAFYYDFDVPVEKIDLTFDKPYLFLIRDKNSGTIWFIGTVYEPTPTSQSLINN